MTHAEPRTVLFSMCRTPVGSFGGAGVNVARESREAAGTVLGYAVTGAEPMGMGIAMVVRVG
jgi:hypothetical protein